MTVLPDFTRRHRIPIECEFETAAVQAAFSRRPTVPVIEKQEVTIGQHAGEVLVIELVARIGKGKIALETADSPCDPVEHRRNRDYRIEVPNGLQDLTCRRHLERIRMRPFFNGQG